MTFEETHVDVVSLRLLRPGLIDTPLKLRLAVFFAQFPQMRETPMRLSGWLGGWERHEIETALDALADSGLFERATHGGTNTYRLAAAPHREVLAALSDDLADPYRRGLIEAYLLLAAPEGELLELRPARVRHADAYA